MIRPAAVSTAMAMVTPPTGECRLRGRTATVLSWSGTVIWLVAGSFGSYRSHSSGDAPSGLPTESHQVVPLGTTEETPDGEGEYSPYKSAVNSALASLVYAIESFDGDNTADAAFFAASSMFDLADYLLHRNRTGD